MEERQIINIARPTKTNSASSTAVCSSFSLPSNGLLILNTTSTMTLSADAIFKPECTATSDQILTSTGGTSYSDLRDPFYASTIPECYALAATTMIAYMLVIMLLITPRTFLHEGAVVLGRRGFTNGPSGSDAGIGIGGRPWLQKVAAMTVAISLTIATADTLKVAEQQYVVGIMDAQALQNQVENGTELKVIRVISDTFLWLAQAQTLIRLFPRQREKIIIKWTAFALITLDVLFSILNNFVYRGSSRPRSFVDAIPALAYLFQLALSLLYAAWVIYYSITKKAFAFYHHQMKNICLVALLSILAVLVPVVFFVLDISKPTLAGWGDYVRWVGAAAASVVVWEWVERIEALERDDKKDGVLGREVFDGDEMLDISPESDSTYSLKHSKSDKKGKGDGGNGGTTTSSNETWPGMAGLANRYRPRKNQDIEARTTITNKNTTGNTKKTPRGRPPLWPTRPPPAATPISRTDTASAESTVYAIRYHPISDVTPPVVQHDPPPMPRRHSMEITIAPSIHDDSSSRLEKKSVTIEQMEEDIETGPAEQRPNAWEALAKVNPFRRRVQEPPIEVSAHTIKPPRPTNTHSHGTKWDVRARLEGFAANQADKLRERSRVNDDHEPLPKTIIPAPPRRRILASALEDLDEAERVQVPQTGSTANRPLISQEGENSQRPHRLSNPYTPDDIDGHEIQQQGALSFATAIHQDREANRTTSPISPISGIEGRDRYTPLSSRSSPIQPRSPTSPRRDGLPIVSIPAPPRRPRSPEEHG